MTLGSLSPRVRVATFYELTDILTIDDEHDFAILKCDPEEIKKQSPDFVIKPL